VDEPTLKKRLLLGEDSRTEFKSVAKAGFRLDADEIAKQIAALANSGGGEVFVGVEDDGTATGVGTVQQADALMRQIVSASQQNLNPPLWCGISKVNADGQIVLVVSVPGFHPQRPFRARQIYYVRDASTSRVATREELERILQSPSFHFDEQPISGATTEDLDQVAIDRFLAEAYSPAVRDEAKGRYLTALKCIDSGGVPTVAGILMFGKEVGRWLPDARVSAVRLPGTALSGTFLDKTEIDGSLIDQADLAMAFLSRHLLNPSHVEGMQRKDLGVPEQVLREAIVNALTHRDYRAASQVRIFVFDDRFEIINPGILLNHLTLDSIRIGGITQRRNPVIAALLSRAHRRENLDVGVPEMVRLLRARGLPDPELEQTGGHFRVVIRTRPEVG
jgi:ATP-dependent DNA helicase RecG